MCAGAMCHERHVYTTSAMHFSLHGRHVHTGMQGCSKIDVNQCNVMSVYVCEWAEIWGCLCVKESKLRFLGPGKVSIVDERTTSRGLGALLSPSCNHEYT